MNALRLLKKYIVFRTRTVKLLNIITFSHSKSYFIYFNNSLYNTTNTKASKIFRFSFKYSFLLLFLFLFSCFITFFITFHLKYSFPWERLSVWETNKILFEQITLSYSGLLEIVAHCSNELKNYRNESKSQLCCKCIFSIWVG